MLCNWSNLIVCGLLWFTASKPEVDILQNEEQLTSGSNLTLKCQVRGYPGPAITWFKDDKRLKATDHVFMTPDGELFIKGLVAGDGGVYTCEALNDLGMDRKEVKLNVLELTTNAPVSGNGLKIK